MVKIFGIFKTVPVIQNKTSLLPQNFVLINDSSDTCLHIKIIIKQK